MNVINLKVDFEKRTITKQGANLTNGDYNSTKLVFEFDKEYEEIKICEIAKKESTDGNNEAIFAEEIINNEVVLVAYADIKDKDGYLKYKDGSNNIYWYDEENEQLYDSEYNESLVSLDTLTKVQQEVSIFDEAGKYVLEISLYGENSKLTSASTSLSVKPEMVRVGDIRVSQYIPVFDNLVNQATALINDLEEAGEIISSNEQTRQANEQTRQTNEQTRQTNETTRQSNETSRIDAETVRTTSETTRQNNESSRQSAENSRAAAEENRETAEQNRANTFESLTEDVEELIGDLDDELIRRNNEVTRQSNEQARISNETARESAEGDRETAETARAEAEIIRNTNETNRTSAEAGRVTEESSRVGAEQAREAAETTRTNNEETRQNNESTRISNETTRQSNEQTRQTNEESRSTAEEAREDAETERSTAESTRVSNETTRQSNEETRQSNEEAREEAEEIREAKIIEFEEEIERLRANTPSDTTNTNPAYINDSADLPLNKFVLEGKTEQESTTGANLCNIDGMLNSVLTKVNGNYKITKNGSDRVSAKVNVNIPAGNVVFQAKTIDWEINQGTAVEKYLGIVITYADNSEEVVNLWNFNTLGIHTITKVTTQAIIKIRIYLDLLYEDGSYVIFNNFMVSSGSTVPDYEPYTGGIPSPNPTYPQEIRNVEGINIFNKNDSSKIISGYINHNPDKITSYTTNKTIWISVTAGKTYTVKKFIGNTNIILATTSNEPAVDSSVNNIYITNQLYGSITIPAGEKYLCAFVQGSADLTDYTVEEILSNLMIVEGNTMPNNYVPYNCIQIKKCNKNIATELTYNGIWGNDGVLNPNVISKYYWRTDKIKIPSTNLVFSDTMITRFSKVHLYEFDKDNVFIKHSQEYQLNSNLNNIVLDNDTKYIALQWDLNNAEDYTNCFTNFQIEEGSTATPFVEHAEKTYNFPLSEGQKLMQDGKIEDKVVNPQMLINLGDLYYSLRVDYLDDNYCMFRAYQYTQGDYKSINYCTHFPIVNSNPNPPYNCIRLVDVDEYGINILIEKNIASTQAELRTWLQNNNVQAQVTLGEPDETNFTTEQQAVIDEIIKDGTYKEVTHYTAEASINPDMEIGYYKDLETEFNNIKNAVIALGGNLDV